MTVQSFVGPTAAIRMHVGPLRAHVDAFAVDLKEKGYCKKAAYDHLRAVVAISRWLARRGLDAGDLTDARIAEFLGSWPPRGTLPCGRSRAMRDLVDLLRRRGILPPIDPPPENPIGQVTYAFTQHLVVDRGLSMTTLRGYVPIIRDFLIDRFGEGDVRLDTIRPRDIVAFQIQRCPSRGLGYAHHLVIALRHFGRFLRVRGYVEIDLAACVQPVAQWRLASVPRTLGADEVQQVLDSCDRSSTVGIRDYAILLLLARLGLRAHEIASMRLEDVHWMAGEIVVRGKGHRVDRLPLPRDVGAALVTYLRRGRPQCKARQVFLRAYAPRRGFASGGSLSAAIVRHAIGRAGLNPARKGAHLLRHSLATHMLAKGASLSEIGQVLRHRLTKTTQIYAKVDLAALHSLAQPWPGGGQ